MTSREMLDLARAIVDIAVEDNLDDDPEFRALLEKANGLSEREFAELNTWVEYEANYRRSILRKKRQIPAQRRAYQLLRSMLTPEQRSELARNRCFKVKGSEGGTYRLWPHVNLIEKIEKHGRYWFAKWSYCLHDDEGEGKLPPCDVTIGQFLMLRNDEAEFLRTANATCRAEYLWNGEWMRRVNRARVEARDEEELERFKETALEWAAHDPFIDYDGEEEEEAA